MKLAALPHVLLASRAVDDNSTVPIPGYGLGAPEQFLDALKQPNATGYDMLPLGFNLGDPTENEAQLGALTWTQNVSVAQVPLNDGSGNLSTTRATSLNWPDQRSGDGSWDGWNICALELMQDLPPETIKAGQDDLMSGCSNTLGSDCINALSKALTEAFGTNATDNEDPCTGRPPPQVPEACREWVTGDRAKSAWPSTDAHKVPWTNSTNSRKFWSHVTSEPHSPDDLLPYQKAVTSVQPLILVKYAKDAEVRRNPSIAQDTQVGYMCAAAKDVNADSVEVDSVPGSGMKTMPSLGKLSLVVVPVILAMFL
ncbi:MAG: hypothetical protein M1825_001118 [Sarcosagium campestre]|nr:MAG: hypothetical protein M1825_001118 [Sarcosagium campestre]